MTPALRARVRTLKSTIFLDESPLLPSHSPLSLPHREDQLRQTVHFLQRYALDPKRSRPLVLSGPSGTGKSSTARLASLIASQHAKKNRVNCGFAAINCQKARTLNGILTGIANFVHPFGITTGLPTDHIAKLIGEKLSEASVSFIIVLDELDFLGEAARAAVVKYLMDVPLNYRSTPFGLVCILREGDIRVGSARTNPLKTAPTGSIKFPPYNTNELRDILLERAEQAFLPGVLPKQTLDLIAENAAGEGSARLGLELLWRSAKLAEQERAREISTGHAQRVMHYTLATTSLEALPNLGDHELIILYAAHSLFKAQAPASVSIGKLEKEYGRVCAKFGLGARKHTQVWGYVRSLGTMGLLRTQMSGKGQRGKTTNISAPGLRGEAVLAELEKALKRRRLVKV